MPSPRNLTPTQASAALGVSAKALRLYERHGLLDPDRTATGWRLYDAKAIERAKAIIALRRLGFSLAQVARVLDGHPHELIAGLSAHEIRLHEQAQQVAAALEGLRSLRSDLAQGRRPTPLAWARAVAQDAPIEIGFALPWPWDGEWFALHDIARLGFITGPLGSGKTRFAQELAHRTADAAFIGLDRLADPTSRQRLKDDAALAIRVERRLAWLSEDGAARSEALIALVVALESTTSSVLVVDMVEEGLNADTQAALIAHLRLRGSGKRALFLMTRSTSILDPDALCPADTIILCPANHSPPFKVMPYPGGRGHEALSTCVATPEVRARAAGGLGSRPSAT